MNKNLCYPNVHLIKNFNTSYTKFLDTQKWKEPVRKIYVFMEKREWVCWTFKNDLILE